MKSKKTFNVTEITHYGRILTAEVNQSYIPETTKAKVIRIEDNKLRVEITNGDGISYSTKITQAASTDIVTGKYNFTNGYVCEDLYLVKHAHTYVLTTRDYLK